MWLNYEATFPRKLSNIFHTHITKGKPIESIAPSETDIFNVWNSLSPNQETLLFVIPHENVDKQLIEAYDGFAKTENDLISKAANISLSQRMESNLPFFVIKIRRNTSDEIEIHIPSKIIFKHED